MWEEHDVVPVESMEMDTLPDSPQTTVPLTRGGVERSRHRGGAAVHRSRGGATPDLAPVHPLLRLPPLRVAVGPRRYQAGSVVGASFSEIWGVGPYGT